MGAGKIIFESGTKIFLPAQHTSHHLDILCNAMVHNIHICWKNNIYAG